VPGVLRCAVAVMVACLAIVVAPFGIEAATMRCGCLWPGGSK